MKIIHILALCGGLSLCGCSAFNGSSASANLKAVLTPANIAKATQDSVTVAATAFLANNPSYRADVQAADDALIALAASNPQALTGADIAASLAKTSISAKTQGEIASVTSTALGIFVADFGANLPTLKPQYQLYLVAVSNGLSTALGEPVQALPVVPAS